MTTRSPKTRWRTNATARRVVDRLAEADATPEDIARDLNLTVDQVAELALTDQSIASLQRRARLNELRARMMLSRFRANAVVNLISAASPGEPTELARKAAVDLLKADLRVFEEDKSSPPETDREVTPAAPSEEVVLRALEQLGADNED